MYTFSIVIPTFNEASDIGETLRSLMALDPPAEEIIVVDDGSTDGTCEVVEELTGNRPECRLLRSKENCGVAAARNRGIREARGDVVLLLNADVRPSPDFLRRVGEHYTAGADYVSVDAEVANQRELFARFSEADHRLRFGGGRRVGWTEGFSCRREVALRTGLFPEEIPGATGEDNVFFDRLCRESASWHVDKSIRVRHVAPGKLGAYWKQQVGRGRGGPHLWFSVERRRFPAVVVRAVLATLRDVARLLTVVPVLVTAGRLARRSPHGWRDVAVFAVACTVRCVAQRVGTWRGVLEVWRRAPRNLPQEAGEGEQPGHECARPETVDF